MCPKNSSCIITETLKELFTYTPNDTVSSKYCQDKTNNIKAVCINKAINNKFPDGKTIKDYVEYSQLGSTVECPVFVTLGTWFFNQIYSGTCHVEN